MIDKSEPLREYQAVITTENLEKVMSCLLKYPEKAYFGSLKAKGVEKVNVSFVMTITRLCRITVKRYLVILGKSY